MASYEKNLHKFDKINGGKPTGDSNETDKPDNKFKPKIEDLNRYAPGTLEPNGAEPEVEIESSETPDEETAKD